MIFVTVGGQMPFDRLVHLVDDWARTSERDDVLAQIGPSTRPPTHVRWVRSLEPAAYREQIATASVVVAHAGMGTVITALELGTPLLVMPRRGALRETRNDHQVSCATRFRRYGTATVAMDDEELRYTLDHLDQLIAPSRISPTAPPMMLQAVRDLVQTGWCDGLPWTGTPGEMQPTVGHIRPDDEHEIGRPAA